MLSSVSKACLLGFPMLLLAGCFGGGSSSGLLGSGAAAAYAGEYFGGGVEDGGTGGGTITTGGVVAQVPGDEQSNPGVVHNPEPASIALFGSGFALIASRRRRKQLKS